MSDDHHTNPVAPMVDPPSGKGYALSGKIMLSAIVVLFAVVVIMVLLHIYARWYLLRHRPHHHHRRRRRRGSHRPVHHLVFYVDPTNFTSVLDNTSPASAAANRRLDPSVLKSLPTFTFSTSKIPDAVTTNEDHAAAAATTNEDHAAAAATEDDEEDVIIPECAVCLSEFEDGERGRLLPRCAHSFHVECIDMWFHSHSTCPLCRSPVALEDPSSPKLNNNTDDSPVEIILNMSDSPTYPNQSPTPLPDSLTPGSDLCADCCHDSSSTTTVGDSSSSSSSTFLGRRKLGTTDHHHTQGFSIQIPNRSSSFTFSTTSADELSPASQSYRSPTSRLLSLRRILSREKKPLSSSSTPPAGSPTCSSSYSPIGTTAAELGDIEEGRRFEAPKTPR